MLAIFTDTENYHLSLHIILTYSRQKLVIIYHHVQYAFLNVQFLNGRHSSMEETILCQTSYDNATETCLIFSKHVKNTI